MSNDLISRKTLMEALKTHFDADYNEDGRLLYSDHICTGEDVEDLIKLVDAQPTAYNPDKVVEQLTQESIKTLGISKTQFAMDEGEYSSYCSLSLYDAIEIVKKGGAV